MRQFVRVALFCFLLLSISPIPFAYGQIVKPKFQLNIGDANDRVVRAVFSSDGKRILLVNDRSTQIWSAETGKLLLTFPEHIQHNKGRWFDWQPGGSTIMQYGALGKNAGVVLWDADTGRKAAELTEKKGMIHAEWNRSGDRILTVSHQSGYPAGSDFTISIRDEKGRILRQRSEPYLRAATFSNVESSVIISVRGIERAEKKAIRVEDMQTGDILRSFDQDLRKSDHWNYAVFNTESPDGKYICADIVLSKGVVCWGTKEDRKPMYYLDNKETGDITFIGFSKDSRSFAIRKPKAKVIQIIDAESGNVRVTLDNSNETLSGGCGSQLYWVRLYSPGYCTSWSPTGRYLAATNATKEVNIWNVATGKIVARIPVIYDERYEPPVSTYVSDYEEFTFNPRRDLLLSISNRSIRIFAPETGEVIFESGTRRKERSTHGHQRHIAGWGPDGSLLITAEAENKSVMLWEVIR